MDLPNTPVRVGNTTPRKVVTKLRKALAGRYYQLLTSHAADLGNIRCWWCGGGKRTPVSSPPFREERGPKASDLRICGVLARQGAKGGPAL